MRLMVETGQMWPGGLPIRPVSYAVIAELLMRLPGELPDWAGAGQGTVPELRLSELLPVALRAC